MKNKLRVVLVDPRARTRQELHRQLLGLSDVDLIEVCHAYQAAIRRLATLAPDLAVVVVDDEVDPAVDLIRTVPSALPGVAILPASRDHDANLILRLVRGGAREFLPIPTTPAELGDSLRRLCPQVEGL